MLAVMLQFVLPGTACIYYGDEIGTEGFGDPFNRSFFDWSRQDEPIREYYRYMACLKNTLPQLQTGKVNVYVKNDILFVERYDNDKKITAAINKSGREYVVSGKKCLVSHNATVAGDTVYVGIDGFVVY